MAQTKKQKEAANKRRREQARTRAAKKRMLAAMEKSLGIVTVACSASNVPRRTHYNWMRDDLNYRRSVEDIGETALDFAEGKLLHQIREDNITAIIFYLKTKGKQRGFVERTEAVQMTPEHEWDPHKNPFEYLHAELSNTNN